MQMILEDSRQQEKKHEIKHEYFRAAGIHWNRTALYCGDYTLPADQSVCIDTKKDIQELIGDIQVKQMSKAAIKQKVFEIAESRYIGFDLAERIYHAICDDDTDRFAEKEINDICFGNGIAERAISEFQALYVKRHGFFHRGLKRAQNSGIRLIVLVDNEEGVKSIDDLQAWVNPRSKIICTKSVEERLISFERRADCLWVINVERFDGIKVAYARMYYHAALNCFQVQILASKKWRGHMFSIMTDDLNEAQRKLSKFICDNTKVRTSKYPYAVTGERLVKACLTMQQKYGVEFQFCRPEDAGKNILELLGVDARAKC